MLHFNVLEYWPIQHTKTNFTMEAATKALDLNLDLGDSFLFGKNDGDIPPIFNRGPIQLETPDVQDDVNYFISSNGTKIELKKKNDTSEHHDDQQNMQSNVWKNDESYGININDLLNNLENQTEDHDDDTHEKEYGTQQNISQDNTLWVEKWKPKKFVDLVGNEATNRRLLSWLRQWTPIVFKEQLPPKVSSDNNNNINSVSNDDPFQRPFRKILLLHGPPGIGKTSVSHIIAKQQGYAITEINASDERSGLPVKEKIYNNLFSNNLMNKPICLIADEIDGSIENGFIKILLDILKNDKQSTNFYTSNEMNMKNLKNRKFRKSNTTKTEQLYKKKLRNLLLRPIICICNNLYSPSLEKLKPHCEIISFRNPSENAILDRLNFIIKKEYSQDKQKVNIDINNDILKELIDTSQSDLRNCINNLQFLSIQKSKVNSKNNSDKDPSSNTKDFTTSWFKIVNELFQKNSQGEYNKQIKNILNKIENNGNYDKIIQGCHSLYLNMKYSDNGVNKPSMISDWLYFSDLMLSSLYDSNNNNNGELLKYNSTVPLKFHNLFSDIANKKDIRIKSKDYEVRESIKQNYDITSLIMSKIATGNSSLITFINKNSLIFETLPYLDLMISTDLTKLTNPKIKNSIFENLIDILKNYRLNIIQNNIQNIIDIKNDEYGEENFSIDLNKKILAIDPPINKIVILDSKRIKDVTTKRPPVLNVLLAKFEEDKVKKRHFDKVSADKSQQKEILDMSKKQKKDQFSNNNSPNTVDFFKNQYGSMNINNNSSTDAEQTGHDSSPQENIRIWVKYKEGFSNAVRKNVSWNNLWQ